MAEATADAAKVAAADKGTPQKADAGAGGTMLDQVLTKLDSLHQRMDGFEDYVKKDKSTTKATGDAAKPDADKKADDGDLELKHEGGSVKIVGKPPEEAAGENKSVTDKKRKDSKADEAAPATKGKADAAKKADWDDEDEEKKDSKAKSDAKRKDEFPPEDEEKKDSKPKADAKRKDEFPPEDEEKEVAKGDARADDYVRVKAADWDAINERLASIHNFVNRSDEDRASFAEAQAKADSVYGAFGKRAPANLPGEALNDYRKRLATPLRQYSNVWKDEKLSGVPDSVFIKIEDTIYADAMRAAESPSDLGEGELRRRDITDPETGMKKIEWLGRESFIKHLGREPRRVAGFRQRSVA